MSQLRIFLSHSSHTAADLAFAREVAAALEAEGFVVLFDRDKLQPSDDWNQKLHEYMAWCHAGVLLLTPAALQRPYVLKEATILTWRRTLDPGFRLFPVLRGGTTVDDLKRGSFSSLMIDEVQAAAGSAEEIAAAVAAVFPRESEDETPLDLLAGRLADLLEDAGSNTLRAVARKLGVDDAEWAPGEGSHARSVSLIARRIVREELGAYRGVGELVSDLGLSRLQGEDLRTVLQIVAPYWVSGEAAGRLPDVARHRKGWALAINGRHVSQFTAEMYVRRAFPLSLLYAVIKLPGGWSDKALDEVIQAVRVSIREEWSLDDADSRTVQDFLQGREDPVFVALPQPVPAIAGDLDRLRAEFPGVVFILHAGAEADPGDAFGEFREVEVILPAVDLERETRAFRSFQEAERIIRKKGG
ncbi:MAG TPA: toll/interleukin-1 receptor domain-containing protein [Longimicrobiaceae bacterium]|nr:toll/interleukin-1 receptor domain-containing protein [Longimicrobiaceae bacterium]